MELTRLRWDQKVYIWRPLLTFCSLTFLVFITNAIHIRVRSFRLCTLEGFTASSTAQQRRLPQTFPPTFRKFALHTSVTGIMNHLNVERKEVEEPVSDANTMVEKRETDTENESVHTLQLEEQMPEDELSPDDYPKGLQFFFILLSLILSIFMVALDLVSPDL